MKASRRSVLRGVGAFWVLGTGAFWVSCSPGVTNEDGPSFSGGATASGGDGSGGDGSGGHGSGGLGSGGNDPNDILTQLPLPTPCDDFGGAEPPCDEEHDLISWCNFDASVSFEFTPEVSVDQAAVLELILLPLRGLETGEGGQGGSADASNLGGYRLSVSAPKSQFTSYPDGTFSLSGLGATLGFQIYPDSMGEFLIPLSVGWPNPRWGTVALMGGDTILEQHRFFLFAEATCSIP